MPRRTEKKSHGPNKPSGLGAQPIPLLNLRRVRSKLGEVGRVIEQLLEIEPGGVVKGKPGDCAGRRRSEQPWHGTGCVVHRMQQNRSRMFDLIKATIICGGIAFVIYSYPVISQAAIIGLLALLWFSCAHRTVAGLLRR